MVVCKHSANIPLSLRNGSFVDTIELTLNANSDMNYYIEYYVTMVSWPITEQY